MSVYVASKATCEAPIHAYTKLYRVKTVFLRYANVVGSRLRHEVVWDLINKQVTQEPSRARDHRGGRQVRSYVYIDDTYRTNNSYMEKDRDKLREV